VGAAELGPARTLNLLFESLVGDLTPHEALAQTDQDHHLTHWRRSSYYFSANKTNRASVLLRRKFPFPDLFGAADSVLAEGLVSFSPRRRRAGGL
jgi:hypothetical protein